MSKIILEFDGVEEQDDARTALDGYKWKNGYVGLRPAAKGNSKV